MTTEQVDPRRRLCLVLRLSQGIKLVRSLSQVKLQAEEPQRVSKQIILSKSLFPLSSSDNDRQYRIAAYFVSLKIHLCKWGNAIWVTERH